MNLSRRSFLTAAPAFLAAPAIIRVASLMPVHANPNSLVYGFEVDAETGDIIMYTPTGETRIATRYRYVKTSQIKVDWVPIEELVV